MNFLLLPNDTTKIREVKIPNKQIFILKKYNSRRCLYGPVREKRPKAFKAELRPISDFLSPKRGKGIQEQK